MSVNIFGSSGIHASGVNGNAGNGGVLIEISIRE